LIFVRIGEKGFNNTNDGNNLEREREREREKDIPYHTRWVDDFYTSMRHSGKDAGGGLKDLGGN
jgi:hypothetical protein